jgi:4-hydroxybenzoate polyprenyltransferase
MKFLVDLVELSRPKHWVKNVFIMMPVPFAIADGATIEPTSFLLGFLGFCIAGSAVYALNDAQDAERDRHHPDKRYRPVASGRVSVTAARLWFAVLVAASAALTAASGHRAALTVVALYVALNLAYSLGAKHVALLDVFLLASNYVLRVTLGCVLVDVVPTNWLLLCTSTLALFVAFAKRRSDIVTGLDIEHRPVLGHYDRAFLDQAMGITAATTLISYSLYCLEAKVLIQGREFAALPFVVFAVLEYLRLAYVRGEGGSPVDLLLRSPALLICGFGWLLAILWSIQRVGS